MREPLLVILVGLFVIVLILRMIKAHLLARRISIQDPGVPAGANAELEALVREAESPGQAKEALRQIENKAAQVKSASSISAYHCAAGNLSQSRLKRPGLAVGFYLKALRADPSCLEALRKLQVILMAQKRNRRLEWTYWEVLGRLDDTEVGEEMWLACWSGLAAIYAGSPRTVHRADAIRKTLGAFTSEDDEPRIESIARLPGVAQ